MLLNVRVRSLEIWGPKETKTHGDALDDVAIVWGWVVGVRVSGSSKRSNAMQLIFSKMHIIVETVIKAPKATRTFSNI